MQGLAQLEQHEIGDVDQIVLGIDARGAQAVLHPLGRRTDLAARDRNAGIAGRGLGILDADRHLQVVIVGSEGRNIGQFHFGIFAAALQVSGQIARHADVRSGVHTVGRESDLDQVVVLDMQVFPGLHAHGGVGRKLHDAVVRRPDAQLFLGAEHSERLHAADLRTFDLELLVAAVGVEHRADRGAEDFQSGPAVRGAADDLQRLGGSHVHRGDVQVVRIGVIGTGHNLADDNALKTAFHGFDLLEAFDFEADVRQDFSDLFGRKIGRDITFEPVIRNIHIVKF